MLRSFLALLLLCSVASAQSANVVTDCTLGAPYDAGTDRPLIQNQSGQLCIEAGAGSGAPADAPYYVTTANAGLSAEVVPSANVQAVLDDATFADIRTTLGLGTAALVNTGTSGATIPLLNGANTYSGTAVFSSGGGAIQATGAKASASGNWISVTGSATGTTGVAAFANVATWNTSGTMRAFHSDILNTASGAGSKLIDLQVGSDSKVDCNANTPFACTFEGEVNVPAEAYNATNWNADTGAPQKDAVRDQIELLAPLASANSFPAKQTFSVGHSVGTPAAAITVSGGVLTLTQAGMVIGDTEAAAATDDIDTISGGADGDMIYFRQNSSARDITLKNGTGNIRIGADCIHTTLSDLTILVFSVAVGNQWLKIACVDNQ